MADPVITLLATGESTTATTTCSFAAQAAGSLLMLCVVSDDYRKTTGTGRPESTTWTLLTPGGDQQGFHGNAFWWKLTNGSETSVQYTLLAAARSVWAVVKATNIDQTTPLANSAGQITDTFADSYTTPAVNPTLGRRLAVADMGFSHTTTGFTDIATWLNSYTEIAEKLSTANPGLGVGMATLTFDGTTEGTTGSGATMSGSVSPTSRSGVIAVFHVATVAPTNYTQTTTEAQGITDSRVQAANTILDPLINPVGLTDAHTRLSASDQTVPEALGLLDAIAQVYTAGGGGIPDFTDHVGILDIFNQVVTNARTNAEALGLLDTANRVTATFRPLADVAGITDSISAQLGEPVTYNEVRLFDANPAPTIGSFPDSPINIGLRFYTYTIGAYLTAVWWYRPVGSPASLPFRLFDPTGALIVSWTGNAPSEGAWNRIDLITPQLIAIVGDYWTMAVHTDVYAFFDNQFAANIFDPPLYADGGASFPNNEVFVYTSDPNVMPPAGTGAGDGYGLDVSLGTRVLTPQNFTDPVGIPDSQAIFNGQEEAAADVAGLVDSEAHVANYVRFIDDIGSVPQSFTDAVGLTDSRTVNAGTTRPITDPINLLDVAARLAAAIRTNAETMGITDSVTGLLNSTGVSVTISDNLGVLDAQAKVNAQFRTIVDGLGMGDNLDGAGTGDIFYFTPPVRLERALTYAMSGTAHDLFDDFAAEGVGVNVWKLLNGSYTQLQPFDMATVAHEYLGGHRHPIDSAERLSLIAAGYGANIS